MDAALVWIVIILLICVFGIIGNCVSGAILLQKEFRSYTNYILLGLTLSDLLLLILGLIRTLAKREALITWESGGAFDTFVFFWDWTCTAGTKYFTVAISVERYIAVCHPLQARKWITPSRARLLTIAVFLFGIVLSIWSYIYVNYIITGFAVYAAVSLHFFPFVVVMILNLKIYFEIRRFQQDRQMLTTVEATEVKITRMLLTVVLVFGICYSFEFIRQILVFTNYFDPAVPYDTYVLNHLSSVFYHLNSSVNFIIYFFMVQKFRDSFCKLFCNYSGTTNSSI